MQQGLRESVHKALTIHPVATLFPDMSAADFSALVEDIRQHGVKTPILVHHGQILDGRHRYRACQELRRPCPTVSWNGRDPWFEAQSRNLVRRHLSKEQQEHGQLQRQKKNGAAFLVDPAVSRLEHAVKAEWARWPREHRVQFLLGLQQLLRELHQEYKSANGAREAARTGGAQVPKFGLGQGQPVNKRRP